MWALDLYGLRLHLLTILLLHLKYIMIQTFQYLTQKFSLTDKIYAHMTEIIHLLFSMRKCYSNYRIFFFESMGRERGISQRRICYSK